MVLIGIGSNRGESISIVRDAIEHLQRFAAGEVRASSLWRTSPVDCPPDSGDFVNAVVAFEPRRGLTPDALLVELKTLERAYGRHASWVRNAPRELDLDLLVFGDERRDSPDFVLPHPRATARRFVLAPAAEVAPSLRWPGIDANIAELLARLDDSESVERIEVAPPIERERR
jgi:2-amino-4-hydroxy-6-hydroxymethyldihydropteridine diphosphokinase